MGDVRSRPQLLRAGLTHARSLSARISSPAPVTATSPHVVVSAPARCCIRSVSTHEPHSFAHPCHASLFACGGRLSSCLPSAGGAQRTRQRKTRRSATWKSCCCRHFYIRRHLPATGISTSCDTLILKVSYRLHLDVRHSQFCRVPLCVKLPLERSSHAQRVPHYGATGLHVSNSCRRRCAASSSRQGVPSSCPWLRR